MSGVMVIYRTAHPTAVNKGVVTTQAEKPHEDARLQFIDWPADPVNGPAYITWTLEQ
jgi:hypothetical protein